MNTICAFNTELRLLKFNAHENTFTFSAYTFRTLR
jgi:hypothetical protein